MPTVRFRSRQRRVAARDGVSAPAYPARRTPADLGVRPADHDTGEPLMSAVSGCVRISSVHA